MRKRQEIEEIDWAGRLRKLSIGIGIVVYLAGLGYAGVRSFSLFYNTIDPNLLVFAFIGILALELTALGLPIALHYWTLSRWHRGIAIGFYVLDLAIISTNSIVDAAHYTGFLLPGPLRLYSIFALPVVPIFCIVGWSLLLAMDPSVKFRERTLATREALVEAMADALDDYVITGQVEESIAALAQSALDEVAAKTLGQMPGRTPLPSRPLLKQGGSPDGRIGQMLGDGSNWIFVEFVRLDPPGRCDASGTRLVNGVKIRHQSTGKTIVVGRGVARKYTTALRR